MPHNPEHNDDGFDSHEGNGGIASQYTRYQQQHPMSQPASGGYFDLPDHGHAEGVELEMLSNPSTNNNDLVRHRSERSVPTNAESEYSSSHGGGGQPDRPLLIAGEPLLQGITEVAPPIPRATREDDGTKLQRRSGAHTQMRGGDVDEEDIGVSSAVGYQPYAPPTRGRSLVRPERAAESPSDSNYRMRARDGVSPKQKVLTRTSTSHDESGRPRASSSSVRRRQRKHQQQLALKQKRRCCASPWMTYCKILTFWAPGRVLKCFGMPTREIQMAWREKMGLVGIIMFIMGCIAFLTFGFQQVLCGLSGQQTRIKWNEVGNGYVVVHGRVYDITRFEHKKATPWTGAANANIMSTPANAGGKDLSFLFQNPNDNCRGVLGYDSSLVDSKGNVVNVFPCVYTDTKGKVDPNQIPDNQGCHNTPAGRNALRRLSNNPVQYSWSDVRKRANHVVYNGVVLDLSRGKNFIDGVHVPPEMAALLNGSLGGKDISLHMSSGDMKQIGRCMGDLFRVGSIDSSSLGCIAANIELYVSLIVILGAVIAKFLMAVYFGWFMSRKIGNIKEETPDDRKNRLAEIEAWADVNNHYGKERVDRKYTVLGQGTSALVNGGGGGNGNVRKSRFFPTTSRYSHFMPGDEPGARDKPRSGAVATRRAYKSSVVSGNAMARQSVFFSDQQQLNRASHYSHSGSVAFLGPDAPGSSDGIDRPLSAAPSRGDIPEMMTPGLDVQAVSIPPGPPIPAVSPWNFELAYTMLLVTCYSEGAHGIRTTLDSLAGTDYPASHKCLFIICDGLIKGAGEEMYTPDVCLSMMTDFVIPPDRVQPYSYVSIAQGAKRHNMAKLYAGYYSPSPDSPKNARENKVPMILVVKCGTPEEASEAKPGNRGKRDSQIILMSFLQRVMFDERMTELEYEMFNAMWNVTGVTPDNFEIVLMVDADTKVYVDSVTHMVKAMIDDPTIMGLCGETKIANKTDSWVSMIQVFEYYIAHHQAKAFESVFGGVTCLPGCFCMYRIKAPKGQHGYWVPILANPDIVENYSENVVDTLHRKNLLLLGEDRYLTTLMLRTFPKRKMMFVPSAVCKTIVPDEFKVLLSQRRRWINSTVHNLGELVLVNDLCGTFCFSMQFIIFMDLIGTLALPAAIVFTFYIIIISTFTRPVPWLPLMLLAVILGLPAVLIGLTSRKLVYVGWMLIYLASLPIWNFVLPAYAFWHFDDFSWGQTRMVQGEGKDQGHGAGDGEFDSSQIVMKRWCDFEADKRKKTQMILGSVPSLAVLAATSGSESGISTRNSRALSVHGSRPQSAVIGAGRNSTSADSTEQLVSVVGPAAQLQMAAGEMDDSEAQAAAGSIERLGYMTPNIIPVLASQGIASSHHSSSGIGGYYPASTTRGSFTPPEHAGFYAATAGSSSGNTSSVHFGGLAPGDSASQPPVPSAPSEFLSPGTNPDSSTFNGNSPKSDGSQK